MQRTAALMKFTISEGRRQRAPEWIKRPAGPPPQYPAAEQEMKLDNGVRWATGVGPLLAPAAPPEGKGV